jgi:hypothetical protein
MVKMTAAVLLAMGLAPCATVYAGKGTDAVPFMKVDTGARAAGLGGAFAALADDSSALFHNPAGMAIAVKKEIMVSHAEWLEGIRNECLSYVHAMDSDWAFGAGASMLFSGSMTKYDRAGANTGNFTENEGFVSLGAARALDNNFSAGAAAKVIYQKADKESAAAYAADAGLLYHLDSWRFALGMENVGSRLKLYRAGFDLPAGYKAAAAWRALDPVWITAQFTHRPSGGISFSVGAECALAVMDENSVYARAGYLAGPGSDAGSGMALGLGAGNKIYKLDYAFTPLGSLGNVHRLSFSVKFGEDKGFRGGSRHNRYTPKPKAGQRQKKEPQPQKRQPKNGADDNKKDVQFIW